MDRATAIFHAIGFNRADSRSRYTETERAFFQKVFPHLVQAQRINRLIEIASAREQHSSVHYSIATADAAGFLDLAEPDFEKLLRAEWPGFGGMRLPEEVRRLFADAREGSYTGRAIVIKFSRRNNSYVLRARRKAAIDSLSRREREIADLFAQGRTYKEIARLLNIAPVTVRHHISAIYGKLKVGNKIEMVLMINSFKS